MAKNKTIGIITIGLVAVTIIAVIGVGFLIYSFANNQNKDQDSFAYGNVENNSNISNNKTMPTNQKTFPSEITPADKDYKVTIETDAGKIVLNLKKETPYTTGNFVTLAKKDFYNGVIFHRVIDGFMIQGGDPTGTGSGDPGYKFPDEAFSGDYKRGTIAMANAGPDTNGSQFFIMHADYPLPKNYVIFGEVVEGIETVDKIAKAEARPNSFGERSTPVNPVKIIKVTVE